MLRKIIFIAVVSLSVSSVEAAPFPRFLKSCQDVISNFFGSKNTEFKGTSYTPPADSHPTHLELFKQASDDANFSSTYPHLPYSEQNFKKFKDTDKPYVEYYLNSGDWSKDGYKKFLDNTVEIVMFPHSSMHGHIRLRIGHKMYGFENVGTTFNGPFDPARVFKSQRALKRGTKAGNIGVAYVLTPEQMERLTAKLADIEKFYDSSARYNMPPFDGKGEKEIKVLVDDNGRIKFHSPAPPSSYGNRKPTLATLETIDGQDFLVTPTGIRHLVTKNEDGEMVTEGYSCASSAGHVMRNFLGLDVKDMPYAGSFLTHLKNGAEGFAKPDAVIHYYPASDL